VRRGRQAKPAENGRGPGLITVGPQPWAAVLSAPSVLASKRSIKTKGRRERSCREALSLHCAGPRVAGGPPCFGDHPPPTPSSLWLESSKCLILSISGPWRASGLLGEKGLLSTSRFLIRVFQVLVGKQRVEVLRLVPQPPFLVRFGGVRRPWLYPRVFASSATRAQAWTFSR